MTDPRRKKLAQLYTEVGGMVNCNFCPHTNKNHNSLYLHVRAEHPKEWAAAQVPGQRVLTPNEQFLLDEFQKLGIPEGVNMMGREFFLLQAYDETTNTPHFSYQLLDKSVLQLPVLPLRAGLGNLRTDYELPEKLQLGIKTDYRKDLLPAGMELGHLVSVAASLAHNDYDIIVGAANALRLSGDNLSGDNADITIDSVRDHMTTVNGNGTSNTAASSMNSSTTNVEERLIDGGSLLSPVSVTNQIRSVTTVTTTTVVNSLQNPTIETSSATSSTSGASTSTASATTVVRAPSTDGNEETAEAPPVETSS